VTELWHYTCAHAAKAIGRYGLLAPNRGLYGLGVVWATDLAPPVEAAALGFAARVRTTCDRTEVAYRVLDPDRFEPWATWAERHADPVVADALDGAPGAVPARWWVATLPVRATRTPVRP
jgi:hypothetical protein